jgi:hypothetical protein
VTVSQFVADTHSRKVKMQFRSIGLKDALRIAQAIDWDKMSDIADAARAHLPAVQEELALLRQAHATNPERMMKRAVLFGIATPNRSEDYSIGWALMAERYHAILDPQELPRKTFASLKTGRSCRIGMYKSLATTLAYLQRTGFQNHWTIAQLEAIPGVGPKVARMIMAVIDPSAVSWTVDLWHQRQILWAAGEPYAVRCSIANPGYKVFEAVWLEYAERYFPGVDTFAVQWASWCAADGRFVSHAALWRDLVIVA